MKKLLGLVLALGLIAGVAAKGKTDDRNLGPGLTPASSANGVAYPDVYKARPYVPSVGGYDLIPSNNLNYRTQRDMEYWRQGDSGNLPLSNGIPIAPPNH